MSKSYKEIMNDISCFIFDVDGVMTDGTLQITPDGHMLRTMLAKDGYALKTALLNGYTIAIISGGTDESVRLRLNGLGVEHVYLGAHEKMTALHDFLNKTGIPAENCLYMGDDVPDIAPMQHLALATCPQDAMPEVKAAADYVSHINGGRGCVRDVIEQVLRNHNRWTTNDSTSA